jgi:hypothetical protein
MENAYWSGVIGESYSEMVMSVLISDTWESILMGYILSTLTIRLVGV